MMEPIRGNASMWKEGTPNPGSDAAIEAGCICPVWDNNRGRFAPWPDNGWWLVQGCSIHAAASGAPADRDASAASMSSSSKLRAGFIVVARRMPRPPGRRKVTQWGWTLHRTDCVHAARATKALPAPADAYPNTIPCMYCRPDGDAQVDRPNKGVTRKGTPALRADRHIYEYITDGDEVIAKCLSCGLTTRGATRQAARTRGYRLHQQEAAKGGGDAA